MNARGRISVHQGLEGTTRTAYRQWNCMHARACIPYVWSHTWRDACRKCQAQGTRASRQVIMARRLCDIACRSGLHHTSSGRDTCQPRNVPCPYPLPWGWPWAPGLMSGWMQCRFDPHQLPLHILFGVRRGTTGPLMPPSSHPQPPPTRKRASHRTPMIMLRVQAVGDVMHVSLKPDKGHIRVPREGDVVVICKNPPSSVAGALQACQTPAARAQVGAQRMPGPEGWAGRRASRAACAC